MINIGYNEQKIGFHHTIMVEEAYYYLPAYIIKMMPCVEDDRSDCQPEGSSIARSRGLRAVVVVEG